VSSWDFAIWDDAEAPNMADVQEFDVSGLTYGSKPDHRDNTAVNSQWTINVEQEVECFRFTQARRWFDDGHGWGLHLENHSAAYVGVGIDRTHQLFLARFEGDRNNTYWHGYPAEHTRRTDDIPTEGIALQWIARNYLAKSKVRKLLKGQRCKL